MAAERQDQPSTIIYMQLCINIYIIITKGDFKRSFLLQTSEIKQLQDMITTMQQQSTLVEEDSTNMNSGYYQRLSNARPLNSAKISSDMETDVLQSNKLRPISDSKLQTQVLKQVFFRTYVFIGFLVERKSMCQSCTSIFSLREN